MNKKTAILIGVIILVLTSIITPFFIRKLNKKVEETQKVQEEQEVQEPVEIINTEEVLKESEEQASGEQLTEENQTESEVEEDEKIEEQPKTNESKVQSTKLKSSLQSTTTNATSNEKQPAKKEENTVSEVQDIEEVIVENAVVIDVASVNQEEQTQVVEQVQEQIAEVPVVPEVLQPQNVVLPDGAVGILKIDKLGINQKVADGHSLEVLKTDLGHVDSTAYSTGNVGILGHNSGNAGYFKNLWDLKQDDIIEYTTSDGVRTYKVSEVVQIADDDWSKLANTTDNRITLITCVKNVPEKRWCIQGIEI